MSSEGLSISKAEVTFDKDGNVVISNKEFIARIKEALNAESTRDNFACNLDFLCKDENTGD